MTPSLRATVAMLRAFLPAELAALLATSTGVDEADWGRAEAAARAHLHADPGVALDLGFTRAPASAPPTPTAGRTERILFAVTRFDIGRAAGFHAYVGDFGDTVGYQYGEVLTAAEINGVPKIIGRAGSSPFGPPDELSWESLAGRPFDPRAKSIEMAAIQRPIEPVSSAHYDALEAATSGSGR